MKVAKKRETTATNKSGYAKYDSPDDSIRDYYLFQQYVMRKKVMTRKEYLSYIGRNYAESGNYSKKVNNIIQRYSYIFDE
jgi:flagellum-specific peptidoglycan hydrolase FlgJ